VDSEGQDLLDIGRPARAGDDGETTRQLALKPCQQLVQTGQNPVLGNDRDVHLGEERARARLVRRGGEHDGTRIGDAVWNGEGLDEATRARLVGFYRLTFRDQGVVADNVRGAPVYLILAMDRENVLRMKPQNLVAGLPIKRLETVT
jgi:hypothetical protein